MKILKSSRQHLKDLTLDQKKKIKDALTYDNPAYLSAKRYSRNRYITIPPYINYFKEGKNDFTIPIGVNVEDLLKVKAEEVIDNRIDAEVSYPEFTLELREDQQKAKDAYLSSQKESVPKCLIQLPTGKGKTILALNLAYTLKQRTLVLVHKDDLVTG